MVIMGGEQYHHNHPSLLIEKFWLCAFRALSSKVMLDLGITCVINATIELPTYAYQKQECMQIAVEDRVGAKLYVYFDVVADKIHQVLQDGGTVLVYCRAGMSRSATLCIAYFIKHHNMTLDEAYNFVRERRPIICPNPGFMKQLRDFEAKIHFRRSGLKRKFEQDDFSFGDIQEIGPFEVIDFEELPVIKPRPKPRIMKLKTVTPDALTMPIEVAQSFTIAQVQICMSVKIEAPEDTEVIQQVKPPSSLKSHSTKRTNLRSANSRATRPKSLPVRPETPLPSVPQHNSNWTYHDPLSVANAEEPQPLESEGPSGVVKKGSLKKRPFSKISEPAKVAVSCHTYPWGLCAPFGKGDKANFQSEVPYYSVFAELHLQLAEKSQKIIYECPDSSAEKVVKASKSSPAPATILPESSYVRARTVVAPVSLAPVSVFSPVIFDCPGIYQAQRVNGLAPLQQQQQQTTSRQHVPSRFAGQARLTRNTATRASIKLPGGLKISPLPEGHKKRPVPNLDLNFHQVAVNKEAPLILERVQAEWKKPKTPVLGVAKTVLWAPRLTVATTGRLEVFEKAITDDIQAFKVAWLLTVPKRTAMLASNVLSIQEDIEYALEEVMPAEKSVMPQKEYPYYSPVRKTSRILELMCAQKAPSVEISWLSASAKPKALQVTTKVNPIASTADLKKQRKEQLPQLCWAAPKCEFDPYTSPSLQTQPMEDLPPRCLAKISVERSIRDQRYRSSSCQVSDYTAQLESTCSNIPAFKMPEMYHTRMIMRLCFWPLYEAAVRMAQEPVYLNNLYCEPTPYKAWAKVTQHDEKAVKGQEPDLQPGLQVACCRIVTSNDSMNELVDIPDVVGDLSQIQPLLATQKDPVKMIIWMEVFKRSVIKARPIFPFVKITEMLPVANVRQVKDFCDCTSFSNIPPTIPTARALVTTYVLTAEQRKEAKKTVQFALQVTDVFRADCLHAFNPHVMKIRAIAQREKAVESTEYIRNYTINAWTAPFEEGEVQEWTKPPPIKYETFRPTMILYMPLVQAHVTVTEVFGLLEEHLAWEGPSVLSWLSRQPFRKLAAMRQVAEITQHFPTLIGYKQLPRYEFVQDIEESPDIAFQENAWAQATSVPPVDSFWFFQMENPKVESPAMDLGHLGAAAAAPIIEPPIVVAVEEPIDIPIAAPGTFQLFLPDPEMMDRVATNLPEVVTEESKEGEQARGSRSVSKRRVAIADPPVSGSQSPPRSPRNKSLSRIVSYQRPRSRSRNTRMATATQRVNTTMTEKKAMDDLNASMRAANELLDRRRQAGSSGGYTGTTGNYSGGASAKYSGSSGLTGVSSGLTGGSYSGTSGLTGSSYSRTASGSSSNRYVEPNNYPSSYHERGRTMTRTTSTYNPPSSSSSYRSSPTEANSGSLWGLLDMAQTWIMSHKSRRDRSEEKAKYLIRKSRQL